MRGAEVGVYEKGVGGGISGIEDGVYERGGKEGVREGRKGGV
jgi:hypothetical protein